MHHSDPATGVDETVLIAESEPMRRVLDLARRAAGSDATILIHGETGTGKELIARAIHHQSPRAKGPFVPVNCGAYTDSLLASELFGHVRGAFTGAVSDRAGVFEAAARGTVFLDEIAAMSQAMQVKMLRVLQERRVTRVGSSNELPVDVRVIAATNADLAELTRSAAFREDLYYRIKVVTCRLPPLRERPDDLKPLIVHYLDHFSKRFGKTGVRLADDTERMLLSYDWPGNVRQLRSEFEQIVAMAYDDSVIQPADLSEEIRAPERDQGGRVKRHSLSTAAGPPPPASAEALSANAPAAPLAAETLNADEATYQQLLDQWTQKVVARRLEKCGGNISKTAQSLAISRSTLYALLKKYGMHGQDE